MRKNNKSLTNKKQESNQLLGLNKSLMLYYLKI